jgi:hypothetical protein
MKRKENRQKINRLFILGAGASYSATRKNELHKQAPLDKDFCINVCNLSISRPRWVNDSKEFLLKEWKDHIAFKDYGLEQAIIRQIGHLEFIDAIHPRRKKDEVNVINYLNNLSHIICYMLRSASEIKNGPYEKFVSKVFPANSQISDINDRIITFNYDELLDKHLTRKFPVEEIYFDKLKKSQTARNRRSEKFDHPLLIKLHGSVNWRCSKEEFDKIMSVATKQDEKYIIDSVWFSHRGTPSPSEPTAPLIIPPLPQKPITQIKLFCFLWTKAFEYLHEAGELIICGYSLPATDSMAQSLFGNFGNKKLKKITIVDKDPAILKRWRSLLRRKNINSKATWNYNETFEEYVDIL